MELLLPNSQGYFLYSKSNCKYCSLAKDLLPNVSFVNVDHALATNKQLFLEKLHAIAETPIQTFPVVFFNGIFLGGYTESREHLEAYRSYTE
tara:strand:- start:99 stop:374 length:276 start_codon:yes stop_codon:yes gene_type:complete